MTGHDLADSLSTDTDSFLPVGVALLAPLLPFVAALMPGASQGQDRARWVHGAALGSLMAALGTAVLVGVQGETRHSIFQVDALTAVMLLLVTFLGAVVSRYSCHYLAGDAGQNRFARWLGLTLCSVLTLIVSGNLLLFAVAWTGTSLSLHRLLTFYPDRRAALLAANKKFLFSRLGDLCLGGSVVLTWNALGTWDFHEMFTAAGGLHPGEKAGVDFALIGFLLMFAALLKSAQFPFHSWLPDTMETPTPVSALMHAGIINAGGFLVLRLSPLLVHIPAALDVLAITGAFTALFASVVMLTQTNVKRSLAYSTIAQMGFMMLQCGLGAFALAALHLVAHSLYKAHAFLSSGGVVALKKSAWTPKERAVAHPGILLGTLTAAVLMTVGMGLLFGIRVESDPGVLLLGAVFLMALAHLFWSLWSANREFILLVYGLLAGAGAAALYFGLHAVFEFLLAGVFPAHAPERSPLEIGVLVGVAALFLAVTVLQAQLPGWSGSRRMRVLYVHLANGAYLGTWANRLTSRIFQNASDTI
ncbi:MAG: NAD(P)H-quinone oxidoreductase subunit 5 [Verrucomicrobia bacterium]|nr:MAG: NAD(P)H-quinone oxidoreductase subunit 5 [Verrucomicrobiota bacterium]